MPRTAGVLAVVTSPLKPPIVAVSVNAFLGFFLLSLPGSDLRSFLQMPIYSLLGSFATPSYADPELAECEAMDLDAQLDKLEKLSSTLGKAKSKVVEEAMERLKIWQSTELELDEDRESFDQLMKDLDLLHR